jgi:hypothetical protein
MDNKWPVIAARSGVKVGVVSAVAWALMDYASQHEERGTVEGFDTEVYAIYSGFQETEIVAVINAMTDKGIIVDGKLANWSKRQPKREDDKVNERVAKHRELKRNVTQCNTELAPEKETDKDTETDEYKEEDAEQSAPDAFSVMQRTVEKLTGYPAIPADMLAINEMLKNEITETDLVNAMNFLNGKKRVRGAADLVRSAMVEKGKRIQQGVYTKKEQYVGPNGEVMEL